MGERLARLIAAAPAGVVLLICAWLLLTGYGLALREAERERALLRFEGRVDETARHLQGELDLYSHIVIGVRDTLMVLRQPDREQLAALAQGATRRNPAIVGLFWAPRITATERRALVDLGRELYGDYRIVEPLPGGGDYPTAWGPAGQRPHYAPILLAEPRAVAGASPGQDLFARPEQHASLVLAAERQSAHITRVYAPRGEEPGEAFAVMVPVPAAPGLSPARRRHTMRGVVGLLVDPGVAVRRSLPSTLGEDARFELLALAGAEATARTGSNVVARSPGQWHFDENLLLTREVSLGHRRWLLRAQPGAQFLQAHRSPLPSLVVAGGSALLLLLAGSMALLWRRIRHGRQRLGARELELRGLFDRLERAASIDGLTRIANRRLFEESLAREWARAARQRQPISLICADIDHFRRFNDQYGGAAADRALVAVAQLLARQVSRPGDLVARIGGEEFALLLPGEGVDAALLAERCRQAVQDLGIPHQPSRAAQVLTISVGVATLVPDGILTPEVLLRRADKALHQSKAEGRNRVTVHRIREWPG